MKRRGRPPYPDILTPRQQEVLALLREGLTNPQIAERLDISLDGAKFLVGEVIGRLGVADRAEAARWQPAAATPLPASRLAWAMAPVALLRRTTPSWLPPAVSGAVILAVLAGVGVLTWAVVSTGGGGRYAAGPTGIATAPVGRTASSANPNQIIFTARAPHPADSSSNDVVVGVYDTKSHVLLHSFLIGDGTEETPVEVVAAGDKLVASLTTRIVRYDIDGSNATELRHASPGGVFDIAASPDGQLIAFLEWTACLPTPPPPLHDTNPTSCIPSPSVTSIGVLKTSTGEQVLTVPRSDPRFNEFAAAAQVVWRDDGRGFVVAGYSGVNAQIATVMLDGTVTPYEGPRAATDLHLISPGARYIGVAEASYGRGCGQGILHKIQVRRLSDGSVARTVSDDSLNLTPIEWSPDGSQFLYSTAVLVAGSPPDDPSCLVEEKTSVKWYILDVTRTGQKPIAVSGIDEARARWYGSRALECRVGDYVVPAPASEYSVDAYLGTMRIGSGENLQVVQDIPATP